MSSSLFQPSKLSQLMDLAKGIQQNDPEMIYQQMYNSNPKFKQFMDENKGLSNEEIAKKYNIPL